MTLLLMKLLKTMHRKDNRDKECYEKVVTIIIINVLTTRNNKKNNNNFLLVYDRERDTMWVV